MWSPREAAGKRPAETCPHPCREPAHLHSEARVPGWGAPSVDSRGWLVASVNRAVLRGPLKARVLSLLALNFKLIKITFLHSFISVSPPCALGAIYLSGYEIGGFLHTVFKSNRNIRVWKKCQRIFLFVLILKKMTSGHKNIVIPVMA